MPPQLACFCRLAVPFVVAEETGSLSPRRPRLPPPRDFQGQSEGVLQLHQRGNQHAPVPRSEIGIRGGPHAPFPFAAGPNFWHVQALPPVPSPAFRRSSPACIALRWFRMCQVVILSQSRASSRPRKGW